MGRSRWRCLAVWVRLNLAAALLALLFGVFTLPSTLKRIVGFVLVSACVCPDCDRSIARVAFRWRIIFFGTTLKLNTGIPLGTESGIRGRSNDSC